MRDWYNANFPSWKEDPETIIATDPSLLENTTEEETENDSDEEELITNPHAITLPEELSKRNIRPLVRVPILVKRDTASKGQFRGRQ
eukprot:scaffold8836_cov89-Skeletonema_marinoi.AAC.4